MARIIDGRAPDYFPPQPATDSDISACVALLGDLPYHNKRGVGACAFQGRATLLVIAGQSYRDLYLIQESGSRLFMIQFKAQLGIAEDSGYLLLRSEEASSPRADEESQAFESTLDEAHLEAQRSEPTLEPGDTAELNASELRGRLGLTDDVIQDMSWGMLSGGALKDAILEDGRGRYPPFYQLVRRPDIGHLADIRNCLQGVPIFGADPYPHDEDLLLKLLTTADG